MHVYFNLSLIFAELQVTNPQSVRTRGQQKKALSKETGGDSSLQLPEECTLKNQSMGSEIAKNSVDIPCGEP